LGKEQYESAEILLGLYLSQLSSSMTSTQLFESLDLFGDIMYEKKQYKRALNYYRQANQQLKSFEVLSRKPSSKAAATASPSSSNEGAAKAKTHYKEHKCLVQMRDPAAALQELESVPARFRDMQTNMALGKFYAKDGKKPKPAIAAFKAVLAEMPCNIEAISYLVKLNMDGPDVLAFLTETCRDRTDASLYTNNNWLLAIAKSCINKRQCEFDAKHNAVLLETFPNNVWLMALLAQTATQSEHAEEALRLYRQMRLVDSTAVEGLEEYGLLLTEKAKIEELVKLTDEVLSVNSQRPTGWLLAAMYCEAKNEHEKALNFVDKAIRIDPCAPCFRIKGRILLSNGNVDAALHEYSLAISAEGDLSSYAGKIRAYMTVNNTKDALKLCKVALASSPRSSSLHVIYGQCLGLGDPEALRSFSKALKLSPSNEMAASCYAEALSLQGKLQEAAHCLKTVLDANNSQRLQMQLAKVYGQLGNFAEAIEVLHLAASLNPADNADALAEMDRIETMIRSSEGEDEDAMMQNNWHQEGEEEEEAEEEEGEGEEEDEDMLEDGAFFSDED